MAVFRSQDKLRRHRQRRAGNLEPPRDFCVVYLLPMHVCATSLPVPIRPNRTLQSRINLVITHDSQYLAIKPAICAFSLSYNALCTKLLVHHARNRARHPTDAEVWKRVSLYGVFHHWLRMDGAAEIYLNKKVLALATPT